MIDVTIDITGTTTLLMHADTLADPLAPETKAFKKTSGKRVKTDDDHLEMARLEYLAGLYVVDGLGIAVPSRNLTKCLIEGARITKSGAKVERGLTMTATDFPLVYDGPTDPEELQRNRRFVSRMTVKVGTAPDRSVPPAVHRLGFHGHGDGRPDGVEPGRAGRHRLERGPDDRPRRLPQGGWVRPLLRSGEARLRRACHGQAWRGSAGHGTAWQGEARAVPGATVSGWVRLLPLRARLGIGMGICWVRHGSAGRGRSWQGEGFTTGGWQSPTFETSAPTQGRAGPGPVGQGSAGRGTARQLLGGARRGLHNETSTTTTRGAHDDQHEAVPAQG